MAIECVFRTTGIVVTMTALAACASSGSVIDSPDVSLSNVEVTGLDFSGQTFRLDFGVTNPNPFPLPVSRVSYGVELDGHRFASGETSGGFTVPANGDGEFAISVELDLLKSAPQLLYTVRDGVRRDIPYALKGQLGVDLPLVKPLHFETTGDLRLHKR